MLHLISEKVQWNHTLAFKFILAKGVLIHDDDFQGLSSVHNIESETLIPHGRKCALLIVCLNSLVFDLEHNVWITSAVHVHRL